MHAKRSQSVARSVAVKVLSVLVLLVVLAGVRSCMKAAEVPFIYRETAVTVCESAETTTLTLNEIADTRYQTLLGTKHQETQEESLRVTAAQVREYCPSAL